MQFFPQSAIPTISAENLDNSSVEEMSRLQVEDTADVSTVSKTCAEIPHGSTSASSPTSSAAEYIANAVSINDETRSTAATDAYSASTSQPMTIAPTIKLKTLFQHALFQDGTNKRTKKGKRNFCCLFSSLLI